jgi:hypothetical protein
VPDVVSAHRIINNTANAMQCSVLTLNDDPAISLVNPLAARDEMLNGRIEVRPFTINITSEVALLFPPYQAQSRLVNACASSRPSSDNPYHCCKK